MSRIEEIKAAQIAAAKEKGEENPYQNPTGSVGNVSNGPLGRLEKIKIDQLAEAEKTGINPYEQSVPVENKKPLNLLEQYQAALAIDLTKIKAAKTIEEKIRIKATVLQTYTDFVNDYVEQEHDYPNDVAVQVMIWQLDAGDIEDGLNLALLLIKQQQRMPKNFTRDMPEFLCDFMYDWANDQIKANHGASPYLDTVVAIAEKDQWDIHPLILGKIFVMLAKHKERSGDYREAYDLCLKAQAVNPEKAGVKGLKERLQKHLEE